MGYALTPGIWSEDQVLAWRPVVDAVHARGGHFILQLWHTGRISHPDLHEGERPVAPSAIRPEGQAFTQDGMKDHVEPRALETAEIPAIVEDYRRAAENARAAGFDGVEIHSANNYLLEQFLRDSTNRRDDEYGGTSRTGCASPSPWPRRWSACGVAAGSGSGCHRPPPQPGGSDVDSSAMETYGTYLDRLSALGLAYTHVIEGVTHTTTRDLPDELDLAALRRRAPAPTSATTSSTPRAPPRSSPRVRPTSSHSRAAFIANPDLVERIRTGAPLAQAPKEYWYGGDSSAATPTGPR